MQKIFRSGLRIAKLRSNVALASILAVLGHPAISAGESASAPVRNCIAPSVRPLPLTAVRLTSGPLKNSQDLDANYLLALEPDRMLAGYRLQAGLEPRAKGYGGWDAVKGKQLTGHVAGHYLSAVSLMYAATGDERFKQRADYLVNELKAVQDKHQDGYLGALDGGRACFDEIAAGNIRTSGFDLNGLWAPWYVFHKTYAGLRDAYRHTGNKLALELEIKFAAWAEGILSKLNDDQVQKMLNIEFGGMNEVFADLYVDTGDKRWLALGRRFEHHTVTEPLKRHHDCLSGLHGNTQIPKLLGSLALYKADGKIADAFAAGFFWSSVVNHHSFATGGHGKDEYFGDPGALNRQIDGRTAESCNVFNMLKLTRGLFALNPDVRYADFQERALFNHVLASQDPQDGWACYMVPVGRGVRREYDRSMLDGGFTCCTASSMESHALHGHGIYYEDSKSFWINFYAPSIATWNGMRLEMETDFPIGEKASIKLGTELPRTFTLMLRRPFWAKEFGIEVNGKTWPTPPATAGQSDFVAISREWSNGDRVDLVLPKSLRLEPLPDNPNRNAILWGPLVLAADLGPENTPAIRGQNGGGIEGVPVFVAGGRPPEEWLKPVEGKPGRFFSDGVGKAQDVEFAPFHQLHRRTYSAYFDIFTPEEYKKRANSIAAAAKRQQELADATISHVQPGEMQPERDANMQGNKTFPVRLQGRPGRRAADWFSFEMPVESGRPTELVVTYNHDEARERSFDILIDEKILKKESVPKRGPLEFFNRHYLLEPSMTTGKSKITVRFQATKGMETAAVYDLRVIRANELEKTPVAPE